MQQAIKERLAAIPGVQSVAMSTSVPMDDSGSFDPVFAADHTYKEGELPPDSAIQIRWRRAFFRPLGTPIVAGRDLTWDETYQKRPVALVSENFAREYWGDA